MEYRHGDHAEMFGEPLQASKINWNNAKQLREWVTQECRRDERRRGRINNVLRRNVEWYNGEQNYLVDNLELAFQFNQRNYTSAQDSSQFTANFIRRAVNHLVSTMLRSNPTPMVSPATDQDEDSMVARFGTGVCKYYEHIERLRRKLRLALLWSAVAATGFWVINWNPTKGQEIDIRRKAPNEFEEIPTTLQDLLGSFSSSQSSTSIGPPQFQSELRLGDIDVRVASRFEFVFPEGITDPDDGLYVIHQFLLDRSEARAMFGKVVDKVSAPAPRDLGVSSNLDLSHGHVDPITSYGKRSDGVEAPAFQDKILFRRVWRRRDTEYPQGVHAVFAAGYDKPVVKPEPIPLPHGNFPIVAFRVRPSLGSLDGDPIVSELIPIQHAFNQVNRRILDNAREVAKVRYLAHYNSGLTPAMFGTKGPSMLKWRGIHKPEVMDIKPVPPQFAEVLAARLQKYLFEMTGVEDVAMGKQPGSVRSGSGIQRMIERADISVADAVEGMNDSYARALQQILKLFAAFATEERMIKVRGDNNEFETMYISGKNLMGKDDRTGVNYFDVHVYAEAGIPESEQVRVQKVLAVANIQNLLQMPQDRGRIFKLLGLGGSPEDFDPLASHRAAAMRAIARLRNGQVSPVLPFQNHEVHVETLRKWASSVEFERLLAQNPTLAQALDQMINEHIRMGVMERLKPQAFAAQMIKASGMGAPVGTANRTAPGKSSAGPRKPASPNPVGRPSR